MTLVERATGRDHLTGGCSGFEWYRATRVLRVLLLPRFELKSQGLGTIAHKLDDVEAGVRVVDDVERSVRQVAG
jgi:hypothetical protein